ncbi:hypothetical protein KC222_14785 [Cedecea davisae]|uniref:Uncharacterized protein n=1 Tax=Cedecea davisae TaxID=158484 RepID=A0ABS6DJP2_9ENTR|nr:hypothetical protein [Cedecea davisae]MBU4683277.1 hypothetical protein [Cedecea davisae]MBU4686741.1 hypothetical protein [Cedecea davisae]
MLQGYFANVPKNSEEAIKLNQRLLAVQAALEIAKAGAEGEGVYTALSKTESYVARCADAIQEALKCSE